MSATILDGRALARQLRARIAAEVAAQQGANPDLPLPQLAVVMAGRHDPSLIYVRNKLRAARAAGFRVQARLLPEDIGPEPIADLLDELNSDPAVHGILLQLPLPAGADPRPFLAAIDPAKDVDGLNPLSIGRLRMGLPALVPCTPQGCMRLLQTVSNNWRGAQALVIGRSQIVGQPLAQLLLQADCTVTIAHQHSRDLSALCRAADIIVSAAGVPGLVQPDMVGPAAVVLDVGITRRLHSDGREELVGDADFAALRHRVRAISPVPGGVGPMTIACLLANTLVARARQLGQPDPVLD